MHKSYSDEFGKLSYSALKNLKKLKSRRLWHALIPSLELNCSGFKDDRQQYF
jgi:hypothetical protein